MTNAPFYPIRRRAIAWCLVSIGLFTAALCANAPLEVPLEVTSGLRGVHLEWEVRDAAFPSDYARQLAKIVRFDLDTNGYTQVIPGLEIRSKLLRAKGLEEASRTALELPARGFQYLVYSQMNGKTCDICFADLTVRRQRFLRRIPLSGNLRTDRVQLHRATREIHHQWFGDLGVTCCKVLYTHKSSDDRAEVWECDFDGANAHPLTQEGCLTLTPCALFKPSAPPRNGTLYVAYRRGQPQIYALLPNRRRGAKISPLFGNQFMPTYSPARDQLAYICDHLGHPELYLQTLGSHNAAPKRLFRSSRGVQASPAFSPDGRRLAFVSNKDGSPRVYVADLTQRFPLNEHQVHLISRKHRENTAPTWSPDGTKLAYSARQAGVRQIWIYDFAQNSEFPLTSGTTHKENPSWAPDSAHLIYNSAQGGKADLYLIDVRRRVAVQITTGVGEKRFASWRSHVQS